MTVPVPVPVPVTVTVTVTVPVPVTVTVPVTVPVPVTVISMPKKLYTVAQVAEILGAPLSTVYMALRVSKVGAKKLDYSPVSGRPCRMIDEETLSELRHMGLTKETAK